MSVEVVMSILDITGLAFGMICTVLSCILSLKGKRDDAIFWLLWAILMVVISQL